MRSALTPILALLLAALIVPASATANTQASKMPLAPNIHVVYETCPETEASYAQAAGCTYPDESTVYIKNPADTWTLFHELGHQFAFQVLGDKIGSPAGALRKFARVTRNDEPRLWSDVSEQFADAYAACALGYQPTGSRWGNPSAHFPTGYGYDPSVRVHRAVCAMILRVGAHAGMYPPS